MKVRSIRRWLRKQDWRQLSAELGYHVGWLCQRWGVHRRTLGRAFRAELHISPQRLLDQFRDLRARELARCGVRKKEIVQLLGYKHAAHLSRRLRQHARHALALLENPPVSVPGVVHNSVPQS